MTGLAWTTVVAVGYLIARAIRDWFVTRTDVVYECSRRGKVVVSFRCLVREFGSGHRRDLLHELDAESVQ